MDPDYHPRNKKMTSLRVWSNWTDTVVAHDLGEVQSIVEAQYGATFEQEGWTQGDWDPVDDDKSITICNIDDNGADSKLTLTAAEWARRDGPCFLCSTEW